METLACTLVATIQGQRDEPAWAYAGRLAQPGRGGVEGDAVGQRLYLYELAVLPLGDVVGRDRRVQVCD